MSIKGQSFNPIATGSRMDFGVGSAGAANVFTAGYTIAVLAKTVNSNFGLMAGMVDAVGGTYSAAHFLTNNAGGRLYGTGDFSNGYPSAAADANGINDDVYRWHIQAKQSGAHHYQADYADLSTLTWASIGSGTTESGGAANHSDFTTPVALFTTGAIYPLGFDSGDIAVMVAWPVFFSAADWMASCTLAAADLYNVADPAVGWLFPAADVGSTIIDFTGGGADETARQFIASSADPSGFDFSLPGGDTGASRRFFPFF